MLHPIQHVVLVAIGPCLLIHQSLLVACRYAATTLCDFVAWILVILWYNRVVSSAGSLSGDCRHRAVQAWAARLINRRALLTHPSCHCICRHYQQARHPSAV